MPASSRLFRSAAAILAVAAAGQAHLASAQAMDPVNTTCPAALDFSSHRQMRMALEEIDGRKILVLEGAIDAQAPDRLRATLEQNTEVDEIWLRSGGGVARAGNEMGRTVRETGIPVRIPAGWACFSACNFVFMGGALRTVDAGGHFVVHMFTHTSDRQAIRSEVQQGEDNTIGLIGDIEQQSALLASEDNDFLIRMGLSRKLLTEVMYQTRGVATPGEQVATRRCLTADEMQRYRVTNRP